MDFDFIIILNILLYGVLYFLFFIKVLTFIIVTPILFIINIIWFYFSVFLQGLFIVYLQHIFYFYYILCKLLSFLLPQVLLDFVHKTPNLQLVDYFFEAYLVFRCLYLFYNCFSEFLYYTQWYFNNEHRYPMRWEFKNPWSKYFVNHPILNPIEDDTKESFETKLGVMFSQTPNSTVPRFRKFAENTLTLWSLSILLLDYYVTIYIIHTTPPQAFILVLTDYILIHQFFFIAGTLSDDVNTFSRSYFGSLVDLNEQIPMTQGGKIPAPVRFHFFRQIWRGYFFLWITGMACVRPYTPFDPMFYAPAKKLDLLYYFAEVHGFMLVLCMFVFSCKYCLALRSMNLQLQAEKNSILLLSTGGLISHIRVCNSSDFVLKVDCYKPAGVYKCLAPESTRYWTYIEIDIVLTVKRPKRITIIDLKPVNRV